MNNKGTKIYLKNKDLYREIIISKELGRLTPVAEKMLLLLAKNIMKKFSYTDPQDREDCFSEGVYQLFKNWHTFNENKSDNPFALFSEIFKRGVAQGYNKMYKKDYISGDYYKKHITFSRLFSDENSEINL